MTAAAGGLAAICRCFACFDWTVCEKVKDKLQKIQKNF